MDCTSSSPSLAIDAPASGGDVGAQDGTLFAHAATRPWSLGSSRSSPASAGRPAWGSWQSSKIAIQIAVGLGEFVVFAHPAGLNAPLFLLAVSKRAAGSRVTASSATACSAASSRQRWVAACRTSSKTSAWRSRLGRWGGVQRAAWSGAVLGDVLGDGGQWRRRLELVGTDHRR